MQTKDRAPRLVLLSTLPRLHCAKPDDRAFELTYLCGGLDFKALIRARNSQAAAAEGLIQLGHEFPDFHPSEARLVAAVELA